MHQESSFGRFVRQRRRELDLTQEELARRVGCAAITIRKIEADDARPSVQIAERLAMALAVPLDDRAEFVRRAREARPEPMEIVTPMPALEEIGSDDLTGRAIRGYALAEKIGDGGMGAVYRAVQPLVEREVAVKIILPAYANHPDFIRRFEAEAQLVARLEHPHIVPLYDYWREPGIAYLVMRLLRGGSVHMLLQDGPLPLATVNHLLEQICYALHAAHRIGVIHRDLKPANVLLDEDHNAYLADFGIAKNLGNPNPVDQTNADMIIGSPAYLSPEQIRSLSVRPQTDIYCLGVMLYELLTGSLPFTGPAPFDLIQQHIGAPMPPLSARREGLPAALDAVIARAAAKEAQDRYPDALNLLDDFHSAAQGVLIQPIVIPLVEEEEEAIELINPYKGLRAFGEADADDYFGREGLIQQLLARLGEGGDLTRFLAVVGPSGSGKSSVVGAGLIPALRRGALVGSENWFVVDFLPGAHPFEELEAALLRVAVNPPASLLSQLKEGERGLVRAVRRVLPTDEAIELVIAIDQFEEVFTLVTDEAERALFLSSLVTAVLDERSRVRVVITLRADFTDRPLSYTDFGELVQRRSEFVLPLTPDEVERAIVGPARRVGLRLESGLVSTMIREVSDQPGTLPLLEYALTELFEKREGRVLTRAAYESIGGVLGALGRRAEEVYRGLSEPEQTIARQVFLRLVTLGEGVEDTRRRVLRSELESIDSLTGTLRSQHSSVNPVVAVFGKHRLLTFDRDPITRGPTVEVAHEALLREWERLREWLNDSRSDVWLQRLLAVEAVQWIAAQREASFLLIGARLDQFEGWVSDTSVALTLDERAYLEASVAERDRQRAAEADRQRRELEAARQLAETERARADSEQRRANEQTQAANRLRTRNRIIAVAGALVTVAAVIAIILGGQANANATRADQNAVQAQTNLAAAQAASNRANNERDAAIAAQATAQAETVIRTTAQAQAEAQTRLATGRELAAAAVNNLSVDPERSLWLALYAADSTYAADGFVLPEARQALHQALLASHARLTLTGHPDWVLTVAYAPDGQKLASISQDGMIKVWDAADGRELLSIAGHTEHSDAHGVQRVAYSPDGKRLVAGDADRVRVVDATSGNELLNLAGHTGDVWAVAFSPDGEQIASSGMDGVVRLWDAATGDLLHTLAGHTEAVEALDFSPDGTLLATASDDLTVRLWDVTTGDLVHTWEDFTGTFASSVDFSPDGQTLAAVEGFRRLKLWDVASREAKLDKPIEGITSIVFSPDGQRIAATFNTGAGTAQILDAATGETLLTLSGQTNEVNSPVFSPDGKQLATASLDGTVKVWDITPGHEAATYPTTAAGLLQVDMSQDWARLMSVENSGFKVWDTVTGELQRELTTTLFINAFGSLDADRVVTIDENHVATIRALNSGQTLSTLQLPTEPPWHYTLFSPDGQYLLTTNPGTDNDIHVWDVAAGREIRTLSGHTDNVWAMAFNHDGSRLATTSADGAARIWDMTSGSELLHVPIAQGPNGIAFSPDGLSFATGHSDGSASVWDAMTGQERLRLPSRDAVVQDIYYSPDGRTLATTDYNGATYLWDAASGEELQTLPGDPISQPFSPDGTRFAIVTDESSVQVLLLNIDDLIALAQARTTRPLSTAECQKYLHVEQCP